MDLLTQFGAAAVAILATLLAFQCGGKKAARRGGSRAKTFRPPPAAVEQQAEMAKNIAAALADREFDEVEDALEAGKPAEALARLANRRRKR